MWDDAPIAWWQAMYWMNGVQSAVNRMLNLRVAIFLTFLMTASFVPIGIAYFSQGYVSSYGDESGRTPLLIGTGITFRILAVVCLFTTLFRGLKAILREKNGDTWDSLLLTPVSRHRIVYEKWWGVLLSERPAFYLLCAILLAQTFTGLVSYTGTVQVLIGVPAMMAFWSAFGLYLSSRMRTVFQATTTAVVSVIVYAIATSIILSWFNSSFIGFNNRLVTGFAFCSFVPALMGFILMEQNHEYVHDLNMGGLFGMLFGSAIHLVGAFLLMRAAVNRVILEKNGIVNR